jgi:hypothetical protein
MKTGGKERALLRRYLLGQLSSAQSGNLTARLQRSAHTRWELRLAEDELIEAYVAQEMTPEDRRHFEEHFLSTSARRAQVELERLLESSSTWPPARSTHASYQLEKPSRTRPAWLKRWRVRWLLCGMVLLLLLSLCIWLASNR